MSGRFVHLHNHTHYSLLDGACRIEDMLEKCKQLGMDSLAITDHGNMFGVIEFYTKALKAGIKPIIGYEAYVAPGDRRTKEAKGISEASYHLVLLAKNMTGYKNLLKLASIAYLEGFYYRPRIDKQVLNEYREGLFCASACLAGEIPDALMRQDIQRAKEVAEEYASMFGEDFFLELQDQGLAEQKLINEQIADIAQQKGIGLIATNDIHYVNADDARAHEILVCVNTGKKLSDDKRLSFGSDKFYMRSPEEMSEIFAKYPEAISNTLEIARHCNLELDFSERHAPVYHPPEGKKPEEYLRELVYKGAKDRYSEITDEIKERIEYELSVICSKGFASYFLITWDYVNYARMNNIPCGARGSACSTVVGYCLGISNVDPLKYELYFERFMDPERNEMPDIDIDICQTNRPKVIEYVRKKYGHVAQIVTFNTMAARAVIRDVGRVLDIPLREVDAIAKKVPSGPKVKLIDGLTSEPELKKLYDEDDRVKELIDVGMKLEGLARNISVHAAGVVVSEKPLDEFLPLCKSGDDVLTQFEGTTVEKVGLLKMDFLGLRTLTTIQRAIELIEAHYGKKIDIENIPLDDPNVFEIFASGQTKGVFQFESDGMRDLLMKLKPDKLSDLIAANALYRPGPMILIDDYIQRKHGAKWESPHPVMQEVLGETYGIMVYQEQVSRIVNRLGNIPLSRSFRLVKAISKKKNEIIEAEYEPFLKGCVENGLTREKAEELFEIIRRFGGYGFNKAHSSRYAVVAYQTAYLKRYYPVEFMAALLTFEMGNSDKVVEYITEARRMGIEVKPPDINASGSDFTVVYENDDKGVIRFGLAAVKGVGTKAVEAIIEAREKKGKFKSIFDFCQKVDLRSVNRAVMEALIKCGAFDSTGDKRKAMCDALERAIEFAAQVQKDAQAGQLSFFDAFEQQTDQDTQLPNEEWNEAELLNFEKQTLGFYVSSHPLAQFDELLRQYATTDTSQLNELNDGDEIIIGGLIEKVRFVNVKARPARANGNGNGRGYSNGSGNGSANGVNDINNGNGNVSDNGNAGNNGNGSNAQSHMRKMAIATLEDLAGKVELVVFPDDYTRLQDIIRPDVLVFVRGRVDRRREEPSVRVSDVYPIEQGPEQLSSDCIIQLNTIGLDTSVIEKLSDIAKRYPGNCNLMFSIKTSDGHVVTVRAADNFRIKPTRQFIDEINTLLGPGHIKLLSNSRNSRAKLSKGSERLARKQSALT